MDFLAELKLMKTKELSLEENISFNDNDMEKIGNSIKTEIKKSNLILQNKFDSLEKEVSGLNLENDSLKKQLFKSERERKDLIENLFDILDIYLPLDNSIENNEIQVMAELMRKKTINILRKMKIEETAKIGEAYNHLYHEALNSISNENNIYKIKSIISQGYIKEGKVLRIAKVIIE